MGRNDPRRDPLRAVSWSSHATSGRDHVRRMELRAVPFGRAQRSRRGGVFLKIFFFFFFLKKKKRKLNVPSDREDCSHRRAADTSDVCDLRTGPNNEPTDAEVTDAWTYLYGRYLVLQQENYDIDVEKVGYNKIKYNPLGSAQFVNPNLDVAYLEAWIVVDADHAVILNVPEIKGRYYTAQLLDGWGEVIANINERTFSLTIRLASSRWC